MKSKKRFLIATTILLLCLLGGTLLSSLNYSRYAYDCSIQSLYVKSELILPGGIETKPHSMIELVELGAKISSTNYIDKGKDTGSQWVYYFDGNLAARLRFYFLKEYFFPSAWQWENLDPYHRIPLSADTWLIQCSKPLEPINEHRCMAVMQYGPYLATINAPIGANSQTEAGFLKAVDEVDRLFGQCRK